MIEEISDEEAERISSRACENAADSSSNGSVVTDSGAQSSSGDISSALPNGSTMGESLSALTQNPEMIRYENDNNDAVGVIQLSPERSPKFGVEKLHNTALKYRSCYLNCRRGACELSVTELFRL